jgi:hypothetical protein
MERSRGGDCFPITSLQRDRATSGSVWLFLLALLLLLAALRLRTISSHLRTVASHSHLVPAHAHLVPAHLLMMLLTHLLLMMHLLVHRVLIHCMLPTVFRHLVVSFRVVAFEVLIVAVKIFSFMLVPLVLPRPRVLVPVFFTTHSCSLGVMFSPDISTGLFTFPRTGSSCSSNAFCAFALLVGFIK